MIETHLRIGRLLVAHIVPEKQEEGIFEIVNQLNRGSHFITSNDGAEARRRIELDRGQAGEALDRLCLSAFLPRDGSRTTSRWELEDRLRAYLLARILDSRV